MQCYDKTLKYIHLEEKVFKTAYSKTRYVHMCRFYVTDVI